MNVDVCLSTSAVFTLWAIESQRNAVISLVLLQNFFDGGFCPEFGVLLLLTSGVGGPCCVCSFSICLIRLFSESSQWSHFKHWNMCLVTLTFFLRGAGIGLVALAGLRIAACLLSMCGISASSFSSWWVHSVHLYSRDWGIGHGFSAC